MIASKQDILSGLRKMGAATRPAEDSRLALYVDFLISKKVTKSQMLDAVNGCLEHADKGFFPSTAQVLKWARPPAINAPSDEPSKDAISILENEIAVETEWMRRFEAKGDEYGKRMSRIAIERAQEKVNRRLLERNLGPRYVGVGVETFGSSDDMPRRQSEQWTNEPEID